MSIIFPATVSTTATEVAPAEDAPLKPIQEEIVEESETALESPSGAQDVVEDLNSPSPSASLRYSNIFSFPADDVVDKFLQKVLLISPIRNLVSENPNFAEIVLAKCILPVFYILFLSFQHSLIFSLPGTQNVNKQAAQGPHAEDPPSSRQKLD